MPGINYVVANSGRKMNTKPKQSQSQRTQGDASETPTYRVEKHERTKARQEKKNKKKEKKKKNEFVLRGVNPFSNAVPIQVQTSLIPTYLSPKQDWGPKRVETRDCRLRHHGKRRAEDCRNNQKRTTHKAAPLLSSVGVGLNEIKMRSPPPR